MPLSLELRDNGSASVCLDPVWQVTPFAVLTLGAFA